jgi:hypothetical protein
MLQWQQFPVASVGFSPMTTSQIYQNTRFITDLPYFLSMCYGLVFILSL